MSISIGGTVGRFGKNNATDVTKVQRLLTQQGLSVGIADGFCGPRTIAAIFTFQRGFLRNPDGLIEPNGKTFSRLNMVSFRLETTSNVASIVTPASVINQKIPTEVADVMRRKVTKASLGPLNVGLVGVSNSYMLEKLGNPRENYSQQDQPLTNPKLKRNIKFENVGPFKVNGLAPAVDSLREVMADIAKMQPDVYIGLKSSGMLVCRYQRNSTTKISNHSWGAAIDLTLYGQLDDRGDNKIQHGLTLIAPIFNQHGWYWGAGFSIEDAMHFECGRALLESFLPRIN
jgi:peptidoglycan hydrolase-like protein with peptidoglycan-binding domain